MFGEPGTSSDSKLVKLLKPASLPECLQAGDTLDFIRAGAFALAARAGKKKKKGRAHSFDELKSGSSSASVARSTFSSQLSET